MKLLYSHSDAIWARQVKQILEDQGFVCSMKNEYLSGAMGELPPHECSPEIWLMNDRQYDQANEALRLFLEQDSNQGTSEKWQCPQCQEMVAGNFNLCWSCGADKPGIQ